MRSEYIDANGIRFHYLTDGAGPLVILLHGFPQTSYEYRHLIPALARAGYRAVAPDMRGFGETDRPQRIEDYALHILGEDVAALVDAFGESKAHVVGHEWGGIVAAEAALSHPSKVDRLVLANSAPEITLGRAIHHSYRQRIRSLYVLFFRVPRLPEWSLTTRHGWAMSVVFSGAAFTAEDVAAYRDAICRPRAAWAGLAYYRSIAHTIKSDSERLRGKRISSPGLILWGERDWTLNPDLPTWLERQFTNPPRKVSFSDVGHWVIETRPDEVALALVGFLDEGRVARPILDRGSAQSDQRWMAGEEGFEPSIS